MFDLRFFKSKTSDTGIFCFVQKEVKEIFENFSGKLTTEDTESTEGEWKRNRGSREGAEGE